MKQVPVHNKESLSSREDVRTRFTSAVHNDSKKGKYRAEVIVSTDSEQLIIASRSPSRPELECASSPVPVTHRNVAKWDFFPSVSTLDPSKLDQTTFPILQPLHDDAIR